MLNDRIWGMDENKPSEYQFIRETIKERPVNKKKILMRIIMVIICGLLFGAVSAGVFIMSVKRFMPDVNKESLTMVNFPRDEEMNAVSDDEQDVLPSETPEEASTEAPEEESVSNNEALTEEAEDKPSPQEVNISYVTEHVSLSVDDYKSLYRTFKEVAKETCKAIVTVTVITSDTDWFDNSYENADRVTGLIVANNGKDLLILSELERNEEDTELNVTFADGTTVSGKLKSEDRNTTLAIISVPLDSIPDETKEAIAEAALGNSRGSNAVGLPVMALGSPLGIEGSQCFGRTTSNQREINMPDRNVHVLSTDIYGSENATGVITDYDGKVIGIIAQKTAMEDAPNLLSAYAISDLKDLIEKLSNGSSETYLGIYGTDVTESINEKEGVPIGLYVTKVALDSPAMTAGIQSGDVITRLGTADITSFDDYMEQMLKYQPGDEAVITVLRYSQGEYQEMTFEVDFDDAADHAD